MPKFRFSISPNLYFYNLLLFKVYKISAKIVQRIYVSWHWRVMQNLKKKQFFVPKMTRISWTLIQVLKILKNMYFDWSLLCKVYKVWPKRVLRAYLSWHWRDMTRKIWRKTELWFRKWQEEFGNFPPEHLNVSKFGLLWDTFIQSRKTIITFIEEVCVMKMKNEAKLEKELTCQFNNDMRKITNFDPSTWKYQKIVL